MEGLRWYKEQVIEVFVVIWITILTAKLEIRRLLNKL